MIVLLLCDISLLYLEVTKEIHLTVNSKTVTCICLFVIYEVTVLYQVSIYKKTEVLWEVRELWREILYIHA